MNNLIKTSILLLALLLPATAVATPYDIEVDGIYYRTIGSEAIVTSGENPYAGDVVIPSTITRGETTFVVSKIDDSAFRFCIDLTSVSIPGSVIDFPGERTFSNCNNLTSITVDSENPKYDSRDSCNAIIETASNILIYGCKSTAIPNTVTAIGPWAFYYNSGLTSVSIPNSVTSIGHGAFYGSGLTNVDIPAAVTTIGVSAFQNCKSLATVTLGNSLSSIDRYVFFGCNALTSVSIPNTVTTIDESAFCFCSALTALTLPDSLTTIGNNAFNECTSLTSVSIPDAVTTIGESAFWGCSGLMSLSIGNSVDSIGSAAFSFCSNLSNITVDSENTKYDSRDSCNAIIETASNTLIVGGTSTVIPNSVPTIGKSAFAGRKGLTSINIPNTVSTIGEDAFVACSGLMSVTIPNSVTTIPIGAFHDCTRLATVTIPNSVTTIGALAFAGCNGLKDVFCYIIYPSTISMGYKVFEKDSSDYSGCTLHVPLGTAGFYQADDKWYPYFGQIVEELLPGHLRGDVNVDGEVNIADVNALVNIIQEDEHGNPATDVNSDGEINIADINALVDIILSGGETTTDGHEYVDLGLPSGTLWATMNIGATNPEDNGDYFAWGETAPKDVYIWETYQWCNDSYKTLTKYNTDSLMGTVDNRTELLPADDAAFVNWGPLWRIPTEAQQTELIENCSWQWTTSNGVNGYLVTGPNGNTMFLPATGCRSDSTLYYAGQEGEYWSRTMPMTAPYYADGMSFDASGVYWIYGTHCSGYAIRAVRVSINGTFNAPMPRNTPRLSTAAPVSERIKYKQKTITQ